MRARDYPLLASAALTAWLGVAFFPDGPVFAAEEAPASPEEGITPSTEPLKEPAESADSPSASFPPLKISRRPLKNFLTDEVARLPHTEASGVIRDFADAFVIGSDETRHAIVWDPVSCRIVGVLDLEAPVPKPADEEKQPAGGSKTGEKRGTGTAEADPDEAATADEEDVGEKTSRPSPYVLRATGPAPFTGSIGAFDRPDYFGFRLVDGKPEFLYTHGSLAIEERLWLEAGGDVLKQRIALRDAKNDLLFTLPKEWKSAVTSSAGEWRENTLAVPKDEAEEGVLLTYRLRQPDPETEVPSESEEESP